MSQRRRGERGTAAALVAGLMLRAMFVWGHPRFVGDTLIYGDLAHNLLAKHVFAVTESTGLRSTLIRLPGYPLFLALCFAVFGTAHYLPVLWVQVLVDLAGCWLLGDMGRRIFGSRVGLLCLWIGVLCPFTANYAAAALTETLSIFCVALGFWAFVLWVGALRRGDPSRRWGLVVGAALSGAVLLRPDGVLLGAVLLPAMAWVAVRGGGGEAHTQGAAPQAGKRIAGFQGVLFAAGVVGTCLALWTVRNWRVFGVVQPLAPKYANDPGEAAPLGFARWYRTWGTGLGDTTRVYWQYDGSTLNAGDLPSWAFDSPAQQAQTVELIREYNTESASTPATEAAFARLAAARVRAHPVRFYLLLPLARLGDMWLRPRTELLPRMPLDWWNLRARPRAAAFAYGYGLLNAALLACAMAGWVRWARAGWRGWGVLAAAMVGFVALRSALLMTIDNSEPRYVLECYPVVILFAAVAISGWRAQAAKRAAAAAPRTVLR